MSLLRAQPLDFDSTWTVLAKQVVRLVTEVTEGISNQEFVRLHTFTYKLATIPQGPHRRPLADKLYFRLKGLLEELCEGMSRDLMTLENMLSLYIERWKNFSAGMQCVHALFDYLNRYWIKEHCPDGPSPLEGVFDSVWHLGVASWRDKMQSRGLAHNLFSSLSQLTHSVRSGGVMDFALARDVLDIYLELGERPGMGRVYDTDFAQPFLEQSFHYYSQESAVLMEEQSCGAFVVRAHNRISSEIATASRYTLGETLPALCDVCERAFILQHRETLKQFFYSLLVQDHRRDELMRLFALLRRVEGGLEEGLVQFQHLIGKVGSEEMLGLVEEAPNRDPSKVPPEAFITVVMQRFIHFNDMVCECFDNDLSFLGAVDKGLVILVNSNKNCAELLAAYSHSVLSGQGGRMAPRDIEAALTDIITCLKYVLDKDVFQAHYSKYLAQRLINDSSLSRDTEEAMIHALRSVSTLDFISRLQRMLADKLRSEELALQFQHRRSSSSSHSSAQIAIRPLVLTTGTWPLPTPTPQIATPDVLRRSMDSFTRFYESKYRGRRITWNMALSRGEVRAYAERTYDLQVTVTQLSVLLVFNAVTQIQVQEIGKITGLQLPTLLPAVASLVKARLLLTDTPEGGKEGGGPAARRGSTEDASAQSAEEGGLRSDEEGGGGAGEGRSRAVGGEESRVLSRPSSAEPDGAQSAEEGEEPRPRRRKGRKGSVSVQGVVRWNPRYSNKRTKVKVLPPQPFVNQQEEEQRKEVMAEVQEDRRAVVQAVIVRVAKARKTLQHNQLISEVKRQLHQRFEPSTADIKKQLDVLIDKEYLERDQDKDDVYHYVA